MKYMNLIKYIKLNKLPPFFWGYVLVILAIVAPWFLKSGYLFLTDMVWGPVIKLDWTNSWFLFNLLIKGLAFIFSISFLEKVFISGTFLLILLGGRIFIKTVLEYYSESKTSKRGLVFILSLFTLFNPFVYDRALYGQFGILVAYGCLFFVVAYLFKVYQTLDFKKLYLSAIFCAIALMFSVHFIFLLAPFYVLFLISLFFKKVYYLQKFWWALLLSVIIVLVINANWLVALTFNVSPLNNFVEQGITNQDLVAFQTAGKNGTETLINVLLMSGFWGKDQFRYFDLTTAAGWQRSFIFLLPFILYGVYLSFKKSGRKTKIFSVGLLIIFISAVVLAIGIKSPLTRGLVMFLYDHLPLYKGLREPQKWVAVIIPIYLFYLTLGVWRVSQTKIIINNRLLSSLILTAIIIMLAPSLLWGFNNQVKATPYPSDWFEVNNLLLKQSTQANICSDKVLFLPWHLYMSFNWSGKVMANPAVAFFSCPVLSGTNMEWGGIYDNSQSSEGAAVDSWLKARGQAKLPTLAGQPIRYIILAKEIDFINYLWLNKLASIKPLLETATLLVYEIKP